MKLNTSDIVSWDQQGLRDEAAKENNCYNMDNIT